MREKLSRIGILIAILGFGVLWVVDPVYSSDVLQNQLLRDVVQRGFGSSIFLCMTLYLGYRLWHRPSVGWALAVLPVFPAVPYC